MLHSNQAEMHFFLASFFLCWGEGRQATFHLDTRGARPGPSWALASAPPGAPRPGAPAGPHQHRHPHPHQQPHHPPGAPEGVEAARQVRRRPPSDRRRSAVRHAEFLARLETATSAAAANPPATSEIQVQPALATLSTSLSSVLDTRIPVSQGVTVALDTKTLPTPTSNTSTISSSTSYTSSSSTSSSTSSNTTAACGPDNSDPDDTCTLCGANPWDLDFSTPGWDGLCPYCLYSVNNPPTQPVISYLLYRVVPFNLSQFEGRNWPFWF